MAHDEPEFTFDPSLGFQIDREWIAANPDRSMPQQHVGSATVDKVLEIDGLVMPLAMQFPTATDADLERYATWGTDPYFTTSAAESRIAYSWHLYVIRFGSQVIVIDTGHGNDKDRPPFVPREPFTESLTDRLAAIGVDAGDVTHVICSHMHYDHMGWNTVKVDGEWRPTFPNAKYVFSRADYTPLAATKDEDPINGTAFKESVEPLGDQVLLVEPGDEIVREGSSRVWVEDAAGHSPGAIITYLESDGARAVFPGDVIHHPVQLVRRDIAMGYEFEIEKTIAVRDRLLEEVADTGIPVFPAHFAGTSGGYVERDGDAFRWRPVS